MSMLNRLARFLLEGKKRAKFNRRRNRREIRRRVLRPKTHPHLLLLEPATLCNLRCPLCPTGNGMLRLKKEILEPETFRAIVSNIRLDYLFTVSLFNWGEPFLNPHIFEYITFFRDRGIFTSIHTNFSVKDYDANFFEQIVASGLDDLTVSVDGASQESYEKYRVGGDFARVIANMRGLAQVKRRRGAANPRIVYKMLLNKFNESEVDEAGRIARSIGAEFRLDENFDVPPHVQDQWLAASAKARYGAATTTEGQPARTSLQHEGSGDIATYCRQMWDTLVVNANGDLFPCCLVADATMAVGNVATNHVDTIWNNPQMLALRRFVLDAEAPSPNFPNLCHRCPHRFCTRARAQ